MQALAAHTLLSSLEVVESRLSSTLVAPANLAGIRAVAGAWPARAVDFFGFECRLGPGTHGADCALNLTPDGARMLAGRGPNPAPPEFQGEAWSRIARFYREWGDTRNPPYADARCTWLEFDVSTASLPAPNLLFGYWPAATDANRPVEWLIDTIVPLLLGGPIPGKLNDNLRRCLDAVPSGAGDFQIGIMLSRQVRAVRVCVFDLAADQMTPYLEQVGWQGPVDFVADWAAALAPYADFVGLHLDVGDAVYPHIGVEPNFRSSRWARQPHLEPRWEGLFDQIARHGLLSPEKKAALLAWVGHDRLPFAEQSALLLRGLSHMKVVIKADGAAIAKAYLGIAHASAEAE